MNSIQKSLKTLAASVSELSEQTVRSRPLRRRFMKLKHRSSVFRSVRNSRPGERIFTRTDRNPVEKFTILPSNCNVTRFDTPENRVITSEMTLASLEAGIWAHPTHFKLLRSLSTSLNNCGRRLATDPR